MRKNRGHWTTTDPNHVRATVGAPEKRLRNGKWVKVTNGKVFHGHSREDVRRQAKADRPVVETMANAA